MPNDLQATMLGMPSVSFEEPSGFLENWSNALGLAITEDLPITSRFIKTDAESMRTKKLFDYHKSGKIKDDEWEYFVGQGRTDYDGLAKYAYQELGLDDIPTQPDYEKAIQEEYATYRRMSQETASNASSMGKVGQFAGNAHAMALDPLYAVSMLSGYGAASTALGAAVRVGLIEGAVELAAQPLVYDWKQDVGADYGAGDAIANIAFAAVGGGVLAGGAKGLEGLSVGKVKAFLEEKALKELAPITHVLGNYDPEMPAIKAFDIDEGVDIQNNNLGPKEGADLGETVDDFAASQEEIFANRTKGTVEEIPEEGVKKAEVVGTEQVDPEMQRIMETPVVREAVEDAQKLDEGIKIMEDCF